MANLFQITQQLDELFAEIEEAGGEITPEQEELLDITESNLKIKLDEYYQAYLDWKSNTDCCKEEKKRIADKQKVYGNRCNRIKALILDAVQRFGGEYRGVKAIELPTVRFSTRTVKAINVDDDRVQTLIGFITSFLIETSNAGVLVLGDNVDIQGILDSINAQIKSQYGDDYKPFTVDDLRNLKVRVYQENDLATLLGHEHSILEQVGEMPILTKMESIIDKTELKSKMTDDTTIANEVTNVSLNIR